MSGPLTNILSVLTPAPVVLTPEYDGLEYRWKMLTFRPACASSCILTFNCLINTASVQKRTVLCCSYLVVYCLVLHRQECQPKAGDDLVCHTTQIRPTYSSLVVQVQHAFAIIRRAVYKARTTRRSHKRYVSTIAFITTANYILTRWSFGLLRVFYRETCCSISSHHHYPSTSP
jgi:hypothetical protein